MEQLVAQRTVERAQETRRLEDLLHRMLPPAAAEKIARGMPLAPESFDAVTIYFSGTRTRAAARIACSELRAACTLHTHIWQTWWTSAR